MSQLDIVYFLSQFPKTSETFVLNEIHELEKLGHSVSVFSLKKPGDEINHTELDDIEVSVEYMNYPSTRTLMNSVVGTGHSFSTLQNVLKSDNIVHYVGNKYIQLCFREYLAKRNPDIVHSHFVNWPRLGAYHAAKDLDIPFTVTAHAYGIFKGLSPSTERVLKSADQVLTISKYNRNYIQEKVSPNIDINIVRTGIRKEKFTPRNHTKNNTILSVGRFVEKKGLCYALEALAESRLNSCELRIVGSGPKKKQLKSQVKDLSIENQVTFLNNISDNDLLKEYDNADVFLLPCVQAKDGDLDGIPVTIMEAMAMEAVPVSTAVSGIPELIDHGQNGYLAKPRNVDSLVSMLEKAFTADRKELQRNAREKIMKMYTIEGTVDSLLDTFYDVGK